MNNSVDRPGGRVALVWLGVVIGMFASGLGVPLIFGEVPQAGNLAGTGAGPAAGGDGAGAEDGVAAVGESADPSATSSGALPDGGKPVASVAPGSVGSASAGAPLTASDVGVTPTEIKIGILLLDLGEIEALGLSPDFGDMQKKWQVFISQINKAGGVAGRKLVPVFRTFDPTSQDDMSAVCAALAQDDKVFAVLNNTGYQGPPVLCLTQQYGVPFFAMTEFLDEYYAKSDGRLFSTTTYFGPSTSRRAMARRFAAAGVLKDRKLGVVSDDTNEGAKGVDTALLPELKRLGYGVEVKSTVAASEGDFSAVPLSVAAMRRAGVDTVFLEMNFLFNLQWVREAAGQAYYPKYLQSDYSIPMDSSTDQMPAEFNGALAVTSLRTGEQASRTEPTFDADCRKTFEQASGEKVERGGDAYMATLGICTLVKMFARGAADAGPVLTRRGLSTALQRMGAFDIAFAGPGGFGPGQFVGSDQVRIIRWESPCLCWKVVDEFAPF